MKDSYPRTRVFPYVLLGIVLFCFALTPQAWWNQVLIDLFPGRPPDATPAAMPPIVVIERARNVPPPASITAAGLRDHPSRERPGATSEIVEQPQHKVWLPPANWVPKPIQPLRVKPRPPVANRVNNARRDEAADIDSVATQPKTATNNPTAPASTGDIVSQRPASPDPPNADPPASAEPTANVAVAQRACWPMAVEVHRLMDGGSHDPLLMPWFAQIRNCLGRLEGQAVVGTEEQLEVLRRLHDLCSQTMDQASWSADQIRLSRRVRFALQRRVDVWRPLTQVAATKGRQDNWRQSQRQLRETALRLVQQLEHADHQTWIETLNLPEFVIDTRALNRPLAERTLRQLHELQTDAADLGEPQNQLIGQFQSDLRRQIAVAIKVPTIMQALETYGEKPSQDHAAQVIAQLQRVALDEEYASAISAVQLHYRNANFRIAVSEDLINSLFPAFHQYAEQVRDTILGASVRGQNTTLANLSVRLIPDSRGFRMKLLANGQVHSNTTSRKGPVTLHNRGQSTFSAGKEFLVHPQGVYLFATQAAAVSANRLVRLQTELDEVPLVGAILRSLARREQADQRSFLRAEIARRVKRSARQRMDREVQRRLATVEDRFQDRLLAPLHSLELDPQASEMRTTKDRVILRARLASPFQFAAHTPRPQARADSKLSVQLHQSAVNNLIQQLDWQGRRMTVSQMLEQASDKLGTVLQVPNDEYRNVEVLFADHHPLEVDFSEGRISLTFNIAELHHKKRKWKNFVARGTYRADVRKLDLELIRDEGVELISQRLRIGDQVALRGIFTKVFSKNSRFTILRNAIANQPRLKSLRVTQLTIRDGWIGLSLGDADLAREHVARPSRVVVRR